MEQKPYLRVNFQVSKSDLEEFTFLAKKSGVTKAKFLRGLFSSPVSKLTNFRSSDSESTPRTTFNLRVSAGEIEQIDNLANLMKVNRSSYLRLLVKFAISTDYLYLPSQNSIIKVFDYTADSELFQVARDQIESGDLISAKLTIDMLEDRFIGSYRDRQIFAYIDLLKGIIARHERDIDVSERLLNQAAELAGFWQDLDVTAQINDQLSVIAEIKEDLEKAIILNSNFSNSDDSVRSKLRVASLLSQTELDFDLDIDLRATPGEKMLNYLIRLAVIKIRMKGVNEAERYLLEARELSEKVSSLKEQKYIDENMGVVKLMQGDLEGGYNLFSRAVETEVKFRNKSTDFSKSKVLKTFIRGRLGDKESLAELGRIVELQHRPIYESFGKYYLYSALLLSADNQLDKNFAIRKLRRLHTSATPLVTSAIDEILSSGRMRYII